MIPKITDQPQYVILRDVERHRVAIALVPGMLCLLFSIGLRLGCFRDRSNLYGVGSEGRRSVADSARLARLIRHGREALQVDWEVRVRKASTLFSLAWFFAWIGTVLDKDPVAYALSEVAIAELISPFMPESTVWPPIRAPSPPLPNASAVMPLAPFCAVGSKHRVECQRYRIYLVFQRFADAGHSLQLAGNITLPWPLQSVLYALCPFCILLAFRPIDRRIVQLGCLIIAATSVAASAILLLYSLYVIRPLCTLITRNNPIPSRRLRFYYAVTIHPLLVLLPVCTACRFAQLLTMPTRSAIRAAWKTVRLSFCAGAVLSVLVVLWDVLIVVWDQDWILDDNLKSPFRVPPRAYSVRLGRSVSKLHSIGDVRSQPWPSLPSARWLRPSGTNACDRRCGRFDQPGRGQEANRGIRAARREPSARPAVF